ncbi:MAG: LysM peptidoglycan-binding domain-containing protein, partial [Candidatus Magnetoovum sp. WYHC-5]|nr:LysM peptidoglycan-binding domain-containing protein [Candidatus Magnetoovum sp. WYHC-5]
MNRKIVLHLIAVYLLILSFTGNVWALDEVMGKLSTYTIKEGDTLVDLAEQFGVGYYELVYANPGIDPWLPDVGKEVIIPTMWVLPEHKSDGILINVPEFRLYYFYKTDKGAIAMNTYPIGIGRDDAETPRGDFQVIEKVVD